jgi:phosphoribosylglycinamide formyltransferase-1
MSGLRTAVLVSGHGTNLQAIMDEVAAGRLPLDLVGVVSDRPGVYALERAAGAGIATDVVDFRACANPDHFQDSLARVLAGLGPDLVVLAGFMRILRPDLVETYQGRMLNIHPSLLPRYPGLHTYRRALEAGDSHHGSTVHFVIPALDAGPAILQYRVPVRPGETEESLKLRVQRGEYLIYPRALAWLAAGRLAWRDGAAWLDGARLDAPVVVEEGSEAAG